MALLLDFAIHEITSDIVLDPDPRIVEGRRAVAQRLRSRFLTHRGEWFLDLTFGTPYRQEIFIKPANVPAVSALIRRLILQTPGVTGLAAFAATFDHATRVLTVSFTATTDEGDIVATSTPSPIAPWGFDLLF